MEREKEQGRRKEYLHVRKREKWRKKEEEILAGVSYV